MVLAVVQAAGLTVVGVGCPQLGRARELAELFASASSPTGVAPMDDLRTAVTTSDADVLLLASPGEFGAGDHGGTHAVPGAGPAGAGAAAGVGLDDWAVIEDRRARGGAVFTLEPMPASLLHLRSPTLGSGVAPLPSPGLVLGPGHEPQPPLDGEWATFVPAFSRSASMRAAADVLDHMGPIHSAAAEFLAGPGEGSLGARLYDAIEALTTLLGEPESVDAMYIWPGRGRIVHPVVGESVRNLAGAMTANLRFADGRGASVLVGDASVGCAAWSRRLTLISDSGRLVVTDAGLDLVPVRADRSATPRPDARDDSVPKVAHAGPAAAVADQLVRAMDRAVPPSPPTNAARVLAVTGAALLSARTGEAESPETILRMARTA